MATNDKPQLAIELREPEPAGSFGDHYLRLRADVVARDTYRDDEAYTTAFPLPDELRDLCATAQADASDAADNPGRSYGWAVEYRPYSVSLYDAERMVKVLRRIDASMRRAADKYGDAPTFGAYVARLADALGASIVGPAPAAWGTRYRTYTGRDAAAWIDGRVYAWHRPPEAVR